MTTDAVQPTAGTTNELPAVKQIKAAVQQLQEQLRSQQDVIEQQRAEIVQLQAKILHLLETLDQFYRHHGLEARQPTDDEIKEHMEHGIPAEEILAELRSSPG